MEMEPLVFQWSSFLSYDSAAAKACRHVCLKNDSYPAKCPPPSRGINVTPEQELRPSLWRRFVTSETLISDKRRPILLWLVMEEKQIFSLVASHDHLAFSLRPSRGFTFIWN